MNPQLEGADQLEGTYVFDLRVSNRTLRINRFFWWLTQADWRDRLLKDEASLMREAGLSDVERALVRDRDWLGLIRHGVNFFVLEKFARVVKRTNLEVYASMRGESLEEFLSTRRVPAAR